VNDTALTEVGVTVSGNVLSNDYSVGFEEVNFTVTLVTSTVNGTVVVHSNGEFEYTPNDGFLGEDSFVYEICDANGSCDSAVVTIDVLLDDMNRTVANDDLFVEVGMGSISGNLLKNDSDPEGDTWEYKEVVVSPLYGEVTIDDQGDFVYIPYDRNFEGTDSFVYEICDNNTNVTCDKATVYLTMYASADLELIKTVSKNEVEVGDEITFSIEVKNLGPADATGVIVSEKMPKGFTYLSDSSSDSFNPNTGVWEIGEMEFNQVSTLKIIVKVNPLTGDENEYTNVRRE